MRLGQLQKASLPVIADLSVTLNQLFSKLTKEKFHPSWGYFGRSSKNVYNLPKIMLHITPWTLILMLHIRQSICLVLTNVLFTYLLHFWCSSLHSMKLAQQCLYNSGIKVDILDACGAMKCSYFGIAVLPFFIKIEKAVSTSCQNSTLLFINGLIFGIINTQNNQSLEFECKLISMIKGFHGFVMFSLSYFKIGWILFRNAKELLK